jgi:hypothetical protein
MASICNDEQGSFGVMSGHDRNTLSLSIEPVPARRTHERCQNLTAEVQRGQVLRGGRSWPSEMWLGAGATRGGKTTAERSGSVSTVGALLTIDVAEQHAAQRLHLAVPVDLP